jgi:dephospho-CoA kinase
MGPGYHLTLVVGADEDVRVRRLARDRAMAEADARARIASQATDEQRHRAADAWLDNNGTPAQLRAAVDILWRERLVPYEENLRAGTRAPRPEAPTLVEYDDTWPAQAARLVARLGQVLGDRVLAVEHIGSTSVPGLAAKDVIDLQVEVSRLGDADRPGFARDLTAAGFPRVRAVTGDRPKPSVPDRLAWHKRFHGSSDPGRTAHVHVRERGSAGARFALLFGDWLRADAGAREEYAGLKRRLAAAEATTSGYADAKEPWFDAAYPRAEEWAHESGWEPPR